MAAPNSFESSGLASAAGLASEPLRPRNAVRFPVAERNGSLACANATRAAKAPFHELRASSTPLSPQYSVTAWRRWPSRGGPSAHSQYPKTLSRRGLPLALVSESSESLTGSSRSMNTSSW